MYDVMILRVQVVQREDAGRLAWRRRKAMLWTSIVVALGIVMAESRRLSVDAVLQRYF